MNPQLSQSTEHGMLFTQIGKVVLIIWLHSMTIATEKSLTKYLHNEPLWLLCLCNPPVISWSHIASITVFLPGAYSTWSPLWTRCKTVGEGHYRTFDISQGMRVECRLALLRFCYTISFDDLCNHYPYYTWFIAAQWQWNLAVWASYQIRKIAGCACAGNAGNVFSVIAN